MRDFAELDWESAKRKASRKAWYQSFRRGRRAVRKSHPLGIPNGRGRTALACHWRDPNWSHAGDCIYSPGRGDTSDNRLGRGQRDNRAIPQTVGSGINMAKAKMKQAIIPKFFLRGRRSGVVGRSSLRNRVGNPAADKAEAAADTGQTPPRRETLPARYTAYRDEGSRNGAPIGGPKRFGLPDLYQDVAPGGARGGCVGKHRH